MIKGKVDKKTTGSMITDVKYNSEAFNHQKNEKVVHNKKKPRCQTIHEERNLYTSGI